MLVKLAPIVKFINILQAAPLQAGFCQYSFAKKSQSQTVIREKLRKTLLYEKAALKMFVKLTPK